MPRWFIETENGNLLLNYKVEYFATFDSIEVNDIFVFRYGIIIRSREQFVEDKKI